MLRVHGVDNAIILLVVVNNTLTAEKDNGKLLKHFSPPVFKQTQSILFSWTRYDYHVYHYFDIRG